MSEPIARFAKFPDRVKARILEFLDSNSNFRQTARLVSKHLKNHVETCKMHYEQLTLSSEKEGIVVRLQIRENEYSMVYNPTENGYLVKSSERQRTSVRHAGNHVDAAVSKFMKVLQDPNIFLERIWILFDVLEFKAEILKLLEASLKLLEHQVPVRAIRVTGFDGIDDILTILPYLTPGILEKLRFRARTDDEPSRNKTYGERKFKRILALEQWRQARDFALSCCVLAIPLEKMDHLSEVYCKLAQFEMEDVRRIVENMIRPGGWKDRTLEWVNFDEQKFVDYVTGPLQDQIGPDYECEVKKMCRDDGRLARLVVRVQGIGRDLWITMEYVDNHNSHRTVTFSNSDENRITLPAHTNEIMQRQDDEEENEKRAEAAAEKLKRRQNLEVWKKYREKPRFEEQKPAKTQRNAQFHRNNARRCNFPRPRGGKGQRN